VPRDPAPLTSFRCRDRLSLLRTVPWRFPRHRAQCLLRQRQAGAEEMPARTCGARRTQPKEAGASRQPRAVGLESFGRTKRSLSAGACCVAVPSLAFCRQRLHVRNNAGAAGGPTRPRFHPPPSACSRPWQCRGTGSRAADARKLCAPRPLAQGKAGLPARPGAPQSPHLSPTSRPRALAPRPLSPC
jgi:hypothetical protein